MPDNTTALKGRITEILADGRVNGVYFYPSTSGNETRFFNAPVLQAHAGPGRGMVMMPSAGTQVYVIFPRGNMTDPMVLCSVWDGSSAEYSNYYRSEGGLLMRFSPTGIEFTHSDGKAMFKINKAGDGTQLFAKATVNLQAPTVEVTTTNFNISSKEKVEQIADKISITVTDFSAWAIPVFAEVGEIITSAVQMVFSIREEFWKVVNYNPEYYELKIGANNLSFNTTFYVGLASGVRYIAANLSILAGMLATHIFNEVGVKAGAVGMAIGIMDTRIDQTEHNLGRNRVLIGGYWGKVSEATEVFGTAKTEVSFLKIDVSSGSAKASYSPAGLSIKGGGTAVLGSTAKVEIKGNAGTDIG